jgi:hypothetical protein
MRILAGCTDCVHTNASFLFVVYAKSWRDMLCTFEWLPEPEPPRPDLRPWSGSFVYDVFMISIHGGKPSTCPLHEPIAIRVGRVRGPSPATAAAWTA